MVEVRLLVACSRMGLLLTLFFLARRLEGTKGVKAGRCWEGEQLE